MKILLQMAWHNIWRNKRRAIILLCAMSAGLAGVLFCMGFVNGWLDQMVESSVNRCEGHLRVMGLGYNENPLIEYAFEPVPDLAATLDEHNHVKAWANRVVAQGMLSTASKSYVVNVVGIEPERERALSIVAGSICEGVFLDSAVSGKALIGARLAEKLKTKVGKKVVIVSQQFGGDMGSGAYRIAGIFDTHSAGFDESHVYVLRSDAQELLGLGDRITETTIMLDKIEVAEAFAGELKCQVPTDDVEVLTWKDRMPFAVQSLEMSGRYMIPFLGLFYIAMAFGTVNTLHMAVSERTHEIGVMRAIGMNRLRLVLLILFESFFLAVIAVVVGSTVGWAIIACFGASGMDLSMLAAGMDYLGVERVLYPYLESSQVVGASVTTFVIAILFSLFPAIRAARLAPVEAIRQVG